MTYISYYTSGLVLTDMIKNDTIFFTTGTLNLYVITRIEILLDTTRYY